MKWDPLPIHHTKKFTFPSRLVSGVCPFTPTCQQEVWSFLWNSCCSMVFPDNLQVTSFRCRCSTSGWNWLSGFFRRSLHLGRSRGSSTRFSISVGNQAWECHHGSTIVMVHFSMQIFCCISKGGERHILSVSSNPPEEHFSLVQTGLVSNWWTLEVGGWAWL